MDNGERCCQALPPSQETSRYPHKENILSQRLIQNLSECIRFQKQLCSYLVIWLDKTSCKTSHGLDVQFFLSRHLEFINTFDDIDTCLSYVRFAQTRKIFFITSGTIGQKIISEIHDLKHISFIYIYCRFIAKHEPWARSYEKISGVFDNRFFLIDKIKENLSTFANDQWHVPAIRIFTLDATESFWYMDTFDTKKMYVLHDLAFDTLIEMHDDEMLSKSIFLYECEAQYIENRQRLEQITDFYTLYDHSEKAVSWYTSDSFVYRLINKALRTRDIHTIYLYRYMLTALHRHLTFLNSEYLATKPDKVLTVYRGQIMFVRDFKKLTLHGIIAANSYFSTTESLAVAEMYAGIDNQYLNDVISVIYEITVNVTQLKKPFAKLNKEDLSKMLCEEEILFSVGTLFRIQKIEPHEKYNKIFLTTEYDDEELNKLMAELTIKYQNMSPTVLKLARYLIHMDKIDLVERFYRYALDRHQVQQESLSHMCAYMYYDLGSIYWCKHRHKLAKTFYEQSIRIAGTYEDEVLIEKCRLMIVSLCREMTN